MDNEKAQTHWKRKNNFEAMELEVMVQEANNHTYTQSVVISELQQSNITGTRRNTTWEAICDTVNAVGKRDITDLLRSQIY